MSDPLFLTGELAVQYLGALITIARTDGDIEPEESARIHEIAARRSKVPVDDELLFFTKTTSDTLAAAARGGPDGGEMRGGVAARELGMALIADAIELATADGDLNGAEGTAIVRFARALGCSDDDIRSQTTLLEEWLRVMVH